MDGTSWTLVKDILFPLLGTLGGSVAAYVGIRVDLAKLNTKTEVHHELIMRLVDQMESVHGRLGPR